MLPCEVQTCAARCEDDEARTGSEQPADAGRALDDLLEIVEHQEQMSFSEHQSELVLEFLLVLQAQAECFGNRHRHECWITNRGQGYEDHPIGKDLASHLRKRNGQAAFSDTTRASEHN